MRREFGNGWKELKMMHTFGRYLGLFVLAAVVCCALHDGHPELIKTNWKAALEIGMFPAVLVGLTTLFSIRVGDGWIESMLFRRWILKRGRVADLTRLEMGGSWAAKFYFADGTVIRFIGADQKILQEMKHCIRELQPRVRNATRFRSPADAGYRTP